MTPRRWSGIAIVALIATALIAAGLLAWGAASGGTGDVSAKTYVGQIGSFEDTHNFAAFAQDLAQAVNKKDVN